MVSVIPYPLYMPNIAVVLKDEITRLSKKVVKQETLPLQKAIASQRRQLAALKRELAETKRELATLRKATPKAPTRKVNEAEGGQVRFQVRGLKTLRARLGLSASDFGKLVGVSGQTIYNWETEKATPRRAQIVALGQVRGIGKREALRRLA